MSHFARQHELKVCKVAKSFIKKLSPKSSEKSTLPPLTNPLSDPHFKCIHRYKMKFEIGEWYG